MFCTRCGHENPDDARFCAQCGAPLARADYPSGPDATSIFSPGALEDYAAAAGDEQADEHVGAVDALPPGSALLVVKPETLLQWHRDLFSLVWRHKSKARVGRPPLTPEVVALRPNTATASLSASAT